MLKRERIARRASTNNHSLPKIGPEDERSWAPAADIRALFDPPSLLLMAQLIYAELKISARVPWGAGGRMVQLQTAVLHLQHLDRGNVTRKQPHSRQTVISLATFSRQGMNQAE